MPNISAQLEAPPKKRVAEPFAAFGIIVIVGMIVIRVIDVFWPVPHDIERRLFGIVWVLGSLMGLRYSMVRFRSWSRGTKFDRFGYFLLVGVFLALALCGFIPLIADLTEKK